MVFQSFILSQKQYDDTYKFCKGHVGENFNYLSYFLQPTGWAPGPYSFSSWGFSPRWFCSEICIEALKEGGVLSKDVNTSMHPQSLYDILEDITTADSVRNYREITLNF